MKEYTLIVKTRSGKSWTTSGTDKVKMKKKYEKYKKVSKGVKLVTNAGTLLESEEVRRGCGGC